MRHFAEIQEEKIFSGENDEDLLRGRGDGPSEGRGRERMSEKAEKSGRRCLHRGGAAGESGMVPKEEDGFIRTGGGIMLRQEHA